MKGTVKWFMRNKGYGVINGDDGKEYFAFHTNIVEGPGVYKVLYRGEQVEFDIEPGMLREGEDEEKKKDNALNIVVLEKSPKRDRPAKTQEERE